MRVQFFSTCLVDTFYPETGIAAIRLLQHFGVEISVPKGQTCCGKPSNSGGYAQPSQSAAEHFLKTFYRPEPIVIPSGSCASMVKNHYPLLFEKNPVMKAKSQEIGNRTYELTQFLVNVLKAHESGAFKYNGKATYHASCQLTRELGVKDEPLMLLNAIEGLELIPLEAADRCCGFGGVFMAKSPEISKAIADEKAQTIINSGADVVIGADHGCLMNISDALKRNGSSIKAKHIAVLLSESLQK
jgi:L-lactate dehydrogenase complex protein LldE